MENGMVAEKVISIISAETDISVEEIRMDSVLMDDLDLSSLEIVNMINAFEKNFQIRISVKDTRQFIEVKDIVEFILQKNMP